MDLLVVNVVADSDDKVAERFSLSRWARVKRERVADAPESMPVDNEINTTVLSRSPSSAARQRVPDRAGEGGGVERAGELRNPTVDPRSAFLTPTLSRAAGEGATASTSQSDRVNELPSISSISLTEDFTPFMQAKIPQALKQQALKALFKEPHFNVMDGLDIYIDDYTVFEPISDEVMNKLSAWKSIQNPLQQVVTPNGYAVDVESEEGKAVLAEQARVSALAAETECASSSNAGSKTDIVNQPRAGEQAPSPAARERVPDRAGEGGSEESVGESRNTTFVPLPSALTPTLSRAAGEGATEPPLQALVKSLQHPRHGKRVRDFSHADLSPEVADETLLPQAGEGGRQA